MPMMSTRTEAASLARLRLVLAACVGLALVYGWFAARFFQASRLASSLDIPSLQRAVALAPQNAAYRDLLCRFLLFDKQDADAALPNCRRATELNPHISAYWLDLALAEFSTGAIGDERQAIRNAVAVDPMTPDVAFTAASFLLAQGEAPEALREFAVAMRGDVNTVQPALSLCWRSLHDAGAIQAILPPRPAAYLQFIRILIADGRWDAAQQTWLAMLRLDAPIDYRQALFYVDALLDKHESRSAQQAWNELLSRSAPLSEYGRADGAVVNGGFEKELLDAGFDWRYAALSGSAASLDSDHAHSGRQSLLISYNGAGGDAGLVQYVPVKPNSQYELSAWVKSEQLDAANGPALAVVDAYSGKPLARTQETLGTTAWRPQREAFQTGPQTELVTVRITRDPAATHIRGKFWIDDVALRPVNARSGGG